MTCFVTNVNDAGPGSFRDAIDCANTTPGPSIIRFAIPGTGPYVIKPTTSYSNIGNVTDQLVILGNSQASSGVGSGDQTISISGELLTPNLTTWLFINTKTSSINFNVIPDNDIKAYASSFSNVHFNNVRGIRIGDPYNSLIFNRGNFENCTFENMENGPSFNVDGGAAVNLKVNNCYFINVDQPISGAFYGDSVSITNSFFGKDKNGVITGNKGGITFGLVNNIRIENNEIYVTTERGSAIYMSACRNVEIKNNIIEQVSTAFTATPLIQLAAVNSNSGNYSNKVVLSGNTIRNAQNESVLLVSSDSMEIYGNTIINGLRNGIILNGINQVRQIKNNTITNHTLNGIHIVGAQMIDSIIQNTISNCDQGLSLSGINYPIKINANTFSDCRQYGLYLNGSVQNSTCTNNVLTQNTIGGIYNAGSTSNNLFINNRVLDNGTYGILNSDGSQLSTFRNNIIRNHPIGMELRNSSSSNRIDSNVFINNSTALQVYNGSSSNVISNNSFEQGTIQIKMYNGASGNLLTRNTFVQALQAIDLTLNDVNLGVGNNAKDTASISSAVKNSNSLILSGTGIDNDTIEVFTNNKTKENALTYVGKTRVVGGGMVFKYTWRCRV
ncbi:MAG: right-handed parallel beta-helix repeat-containing protein [Cytophagaceae bacterium]|jgi:parallel beta-helix repeat protein|nr:right-handed parallel beta-helix repeat-containing protein [Cytophagaceae bacterium]